MIYGWTLFIFIICNVFPRVCLYILSLNIIRPHRSETLSLYLFFLSLLFFIPSLRHVQRSPVPNFSSAAATSLRIIINTRTREQTYNQADSRAQQRFAFFKNGIKNATRKQRITLQLRWTDLTLITASKSISPPGCFKITNISLPRVFRVSAYL